MPLRDTGPADPSTANEFRSVDDTSRTMNSWVLATWVGVAMVVLLPAVFVYVTPAPVAPNWGLALLVTTMCGVRFGWIVGDGRRRLYELTFWVFTYVFLGLAPLVQLRAGRTPITTPRVDTALNGTAMLIIIVGIVAFAVGLALPMPRPRLLRAEVRVVGIDLERTIILALFALAITVYFVASVGITALFSSRYEILDSVTAVWGQGTVAPLATPLIAGGALLIAFIALVKYIAETGNREWPLIGLTVFVALALAITILNPITSPRTHFGTAAMAIAAVFGLFSTPKLFRLTAVLWVVVLIVVFPVSDYFRTPDPTLKTSSVLESLITPDFSGFAEINNTLLYVQRYGNTHGNQAAGVALFWVPRQLWPEKPVDTTQLVAASRGYSFQILGAPFWSELYINGGWPLMVIGMFALGVVVRALDGRIAESLQRARAPGILGCVVPFYFIILLRGSLLQAMGFLFVLVAGSVFVSRWRRVPSR